MFLLNEAKKEVKEAVKAAKIYVADLLADEGVANIALEEVNFDKDYWLITIGFTRALKAERRKRTGLAGIYKALDENELLKRTYRIVKVGEPDGKVTAMIKPEYAD